MRITDLCDGWKFRQAAPGCGYYRPCVPEDGWREARVPGHVHLDLARHGIVGDPHAMQYERGCQWGDEASWEYSAFFDWQPDPSLPRRVLRFEGLDTLATIRLNGDVVAESRSMFLPLEIDVTDRLQPGSNSLAVLFQSAVVEGDRLRSEYFAREGLRTDTTFFDERAFVRKAQFMSGWDWGPRLVSCGIWRPVRLLEFAGRIVDLEILQTSLGSGRFRLEARPIVEGASEIPLLSFDGSEFRAAIDLEIEPELWQPNGFGEPRLYTLSARMPGGNAVERKVGFRTMELIQEADAHGRSFAFIVNGERLFARGANWIPNDSFPSITDPATVQEQIRSCADLGFNMLRVWGGGLYESEAFYDACDANGILVWQDFPFACSYYPDDPGFLGTVAQEAEAHVRRLRHRPSLALWCGNNECHMMWEQRWGKDELVPPRFYGEAMYEELLPAVLARLDPDRPYVSGSPLGTGPEGATDPAGHSGANMGGYGDQHFWDVWHGRGDWRHYRDSFARFSSEFGFASSCSAAAWRQVFPQGLPERRDDPAVRFHDRTGKPYEVFSGFVAEHYPDSEELEDWIYFSQLNQRDAMRCAIEHYRASDFCEGALLWQFNDCWPSQSWAVQDSARLMKPAGYELRRLFAPAMLAVDRDAELVRIRMAADRLASVPIEVDFFDSAGGPIARHSFRAELGRGEVIERDVSGMDPERTVLRARIAWQTGSERWACLAEPKAMRWGPVQVEAQAEAGFLRIDVEGLAMDLVLFDAVTHLPLPAEGETVRGYRALTLCNESGRFHMPELGARLAGRCLAGRIEIQGLP